jgi:hypothetical protein
MTNPKLKRAGINRIERDNYKKTLKLTYQQKNVLIGGLLGDGSLFTRAKQDKFPLFLYQFKQKEAHKDYVLHIFSIFENLCTTEPKKVLNYKSITNLEYFAYSFKTVALPCFKFYGDQFYKLDVKTNKKVKIVPKLIHRWLNPEVLAYWFMDDGSKDSSGYRLNTQSFSLKENERLADALGKRFKFEVNIHKDNNYKTGKKGYRLYITAKSRNNFTEIVYPYIHPSFYYKLFKN